MVKLLQYFNGIKNNSAQSFFWVVLFLFTLAHIIIYVIMPYTCDDYWYMTPLRDYCMGVDTSFPADELMSIWRDHYATDNIRLANVIFTFTLLIPKIIPSIISGMLVGVILWLSAKVATINWRNAFLMTVLALMISFMLPWYEEMFTQCFALNYVWPSALALWLAYMFFNDGTRMGVVASLLLGLLLGAWHEGIAVPLLAGFVVYMMLHRSQANRRRIAMIVGLIVGVLWLVSAPGLQANVGYKTKALQMSAILNKIALYHIPLLILLLSISIATIKKNTRKLIFDPIFVSFVVICIVGVAINLITNVGVRTGWMGYLFGIIATIYLWKNMKDVRCGQANSMIKRIATISIALFLLVHYVVVIYYSVVVRNEVEYVLSQYEKSTDGQVFADVTYDYQASPLAWKKPYFEIFTYDWVMYWIDKYFSDDAKHLRVIPTCMENAEMLRSEKVVGDNPFYMFNGYLYAPIRDEERVEATTTYEIDFGFTEKTLTCTNFVFTTASGNKYYFSFPQRATVHRWVGEIEEMNLR